MINHRYSLIIHDWMIRTLQLKNTELLVYAFIYQMGQSSGEITIDKKMLSNLFETSKNAVTNALGNLIERGYLEDLGNDTYGLNFIQSVMSTNGEEIQTILPMSIEDMEGKDGTNGESGRDVIDFDAVIETFNSITKGVFGRVSTKNIPVKRKALIRARIRDYSLQTLYDVFYMASLSNFLKGEKGWVATFDWLLRPTNFEKVLSGYYKTSSVKAGSRDWSDIASANQRAMDEAMKAMGMTFDEQQ